MTVSADLGQFAQGLASWRRLLASAPSDEVGWKIFNDAAFDVAGYVNRGLDRTLAADELFEMASAQGWGEQADEVQTVITDAFAAVKPNGRTREARQEAREEGPQHVATRYVFPNPFAIPPREFLYGGHYVRGAATATVAPGGFGKTTLSLFEAIDMAAQGRRVWYVSGEDPKVEIDRRIAAHCQQHPRLDQAVVASNLWVDDKESFPLFIGTCPRVSMLVPNKQWLARFEQQILENRIDVIILDPFISFHTVPENDNGAIDQVVKTLGLIAQRRKCCIELSHHVRKPIQGQDELTVDDARGGGAIINAVRSARVINRMSTFDAERARLKDTAKRSAYIRVDKGKRNMAPAEAAVWFQIVSVMLPNTDNVQSIIPWMFPASFDPLEQTEKDWVQRLLEREGPRRADSQSADWLGYDVGRHCDRADMDTASGKKWAREIINKWARDRVIKEVNIPGRGRHDVKGWAHPDWVEDNVLPFKPRET